MTKDLALYIDGRFIPADFLPAFLDTKFVLIG